MNENEFRHTLDTHTCTDMTWVAHEHEAKHTHTHTHMHAEKANRADVHSCLNHSEEPSRCSSPKSSSLKSWPLLGPLSVDHSSR